MEKLIIALQVYFDKNVKKLPERMIIAKTIYKYAKFEKIPSKENIKYDTRLYNDALLDLATDPVVLSTGEILYILKKFDQSVTYNPSSKSMYDFASIVKKLSVYRNRDFKKAFLMVSNGGLNTIHHINENIMPFITDPRYKWQKNLLREISSAPQQRCELIKTLFDNHFDDLEGNLLHIAETINEYVSETRLTSACKWMNETNILSINRQTHDATLETLNHFKNHHDQKQLFSCLNLWQRKK